MWLSSALTCLEAWAFPAVCALCGDRGAAAGFDLCTGCEADLPTWPPPDVTADRLIPPACLVREAALDCLWSAFSYAFPVDALIRDLKFGGHLPHASLLGQALWRRLQNQDAVRDIDVLLPVPLHVARLRERGFNQCFEIARPLCKAWSVPLLQRAVVRGRATQPQTTLAADARLGNVRGAFRVLRPLHGLRIAVLDDVLTTGATLTELAVTLRRAGAARVVAISVARAARAGPSGMHHQG